MAADLLFGGIFVVMLAYGIILQQSISTNLNTNILNRTNTTKMPSFFNDSVLNTTVLNTTVLNTTVLDVTNCEIILEKYLKIFTDDMSQKNENYFVIEIHIPQLFASIKILNFLLSVSISILYHGIVSMLYIALLSMLLYFIHIFYTEYNVVAPPPPYHTNDIHWLNDNSL